MFLEQFFVLANVFFCDGYLAIGFRFDVNHFDVAKHRRIHFLAIVLVSRNAREILLQLLDVNIPKTIRLAFLAVMLDANKTFRVRIVFNVRDLDTV